MIELAGCTGIGMCKPSEVLGGFWRIGEKWQPPYGKNIQPSRK
jgi:hypothetical protein